MTAAPAMTGLPLHWANVSHAYGPLRVLESVTLAIGAGECVALLGHNGAGKTTLTRMLMGLIRPTTGSVAVGDVRVAQRRPDEMAAHVGYAFQHADQQLFARSVREDVRFGPKQLRRPVEHADSVLAELGLDGVAERHPYDLPAPVRKLVTLAGVFAMQTPVLVLDEPTAGFDRDLRARVVAAVRRRAEAGRTILFVSHDLAFIDAVARRRVTLEGGRVVEDSAQS